MMPFAHGAVNLYLVVRQDNFSLYFPVPCCVALPKKVLWKQGASGAAADWSQRSHSGAGTAKNSNLTDFDES